MTLHSESLSLKTLPTCDAQTLECLFWQSAQPPLPEIDNPHVFHTTRSVEDCRLEKEAWFSRVLLEWGQCGCIITEDHRMLGSAIYAPPAMVPRVASFPSGPISADAIQLLSLSTISSADSYGYRQKMVDEVVADLRDRGVKAIEAIALANDTDVEVASILAGTPAPPKPRASTTSHKYHRCTLTTCMIDADFLVAYGFELVGPHPRFPRYRFTIDHNHQWKADVEKALASLSDEMVIINAGADANATVKVQLSAAETFRRQ